MAVAVGGLLTVGGPAGAQGTTGPKIGKVDMERVWQGYTLYKKLSESYDKLRNDLEGQYAERRRRFPLLLADEWDRYLALRAKGEKINADERAEMGRLERLSNDRDAELGKLQNMADNAMTAEQRQRRQLLIRWQTEAQNAVAQLEKNLKVTLANKDSEMSALLKRNIETASADLAKEKDLLVIVNSEAVLFGGLDVTDDLVKKLNALPETPAVPTKPK
jgi:Skp family chaperone for outer membrane proteins